MSSLPRASADEEEFGRRARDRIRRAFGWSIPHPRILLSFQGSGWALDHAPFTLPEAKQFRALLDTSIAVYETTHPHATELSFEPTKEEAMPITEPDEIAGYGPGRIEKAMLRGSRIAPDGERPLEIVGAWNAHRAMISEIERVTRVLLDRLSNAGLLTNVSIPIGRAESPEAASPFGAQIIDATAELDLSRGVLADITARLEI